MQFSPIHGHWFLHDSSYELIRLLLKLFTAFLVNKDIRQLSPINTWIKRALVGKEQTREKKMARLLMEQRSSQEKLTNRRKRIVHNRQHKMAVLWCQMSDCFLVQCKTDSLCRTAFLGETPKKDQYRVLVSCSYCFWWIIGMS